jgi:hypothetical protein
MGPLPTRIGVPPGRFPPRQSIVEEYRSCRSIVMDPKPNSGGEHATTHIVAFAKQRLFPGWGLEFLD